MHECRKVPACDACGGKLFKTVTMSRAEGSRLFILEKFIFLEKKSGGRGYLRVALIHFWHGTSERELCNWWSQFFEDIIYVHHMDPINSYNFDATRKLVPVILDNRPIVAILKNRQWLLTITYSLNKRPIT